MADRLPLYQAYIRLPGAMPTVLSSETTKYGAQHATEQPLEYSTEYGPTTGLHIFWLKTTPCCSTPPAVRRITASIQHLPAVPTSTTTWFREWYNMLRTEPLTCSSMQELPIRCGCRTISSRATVHVVVCMVFIPQPRSTPSSTTTG